MTPEMQTTYKGRIIEQWQEDETFHLELIVGSDRLVFHSKTTFSDLAGPLTIPAEPSQPQTSHPGYTSQSRKQDSFDRGTLVSVLVTGDGEVVSISRLGGPSGKVWSPHADSMRWRAKLDGPSRMQKLHQRQEIMRALREDLYQNDFLEIETPLLVKGTCPDTHIETIRTSNGHEEGYLVTSTEYQIKRMVVGGFENVFTLTKNFRANDRGRYHSTEFTMLEWARSFGSLNEIEEDAIRFIRRAFLGLYPNQTALPYSGQEIDLVSQPWERVTVREAFRKYLGLIDVKDFSREALTSAAKSAGVSIPEEFKTDQHLVLSFLLDRLQPYLGHRTPTFLREWPAFMTTSARVSANDPFVAERSELYIAGIEIADGFPFLRNSAQQRTFFRREAERRKDENKEPVTLDERYIEALEEGIPPGAGMALGVDRLVMVLTQSGTLSEVQCFSWEEL